MINIDQINDELGENHVATSANNPLRNAAFNLSDEQKKEFSKKRSGPNNGQFGKKIPDSVKEKMVSKNNRTFLKI
jgi:hypothetical protein